MSASDFSHGYDADGMASLIESIKSIVLTQAGDAAMDISSIQTACDNYWEGKAKENFLTNLAKDAQMFKDNITSLETAFETEINNTGAEYKEFDQNLIKAE